MIDVLIEDDRWTQAELGPLAQRAEAATLTHLGFDPDLCEVSLLACDDARIAVLNADFRDKANPTNVLSWPAEDLAPDAPGDAPWPPEPEPDGTFALGDIAIAYDTCAREAQAADKPHGRSCDPSDCSRFASSFRL